MDTIITVLLISMSSLSMTYCYYKCKTPTTKPSLTKLRYIRYNEMV